MPTHSTILMAKAADYRTRAAAAQSSLLGWALQAVAQEFERQARTIDPDIEAEAATEPTPVRPSRIDKRV
jgi:hypothetical protein